MLESGEAPVPPAVAGNHDVVGVGLGDPGGDGSDTAAGHQFDANGGARIDALEIEDELREIFNGINIVVRRGADERDAGLRMAQAGNQLGDLVAGELATFTGLGPLSDLDFYLFGMGEIFRSDAKACGSDLLDLAIVKSGRAGKMAGIVGRIFSALSGVRTRSDRVHRRGNRPMSLRAERAEGHGGGDEAMRNVRGSFHLIDGERRRGGTNLQEIAEHRGMSIDCLVTEERPSLGGVESGGGVSGAGDQLQGAHGLRLPAMRLGAIVLAETEPAVVGQELVLDCNGNRNRNGGERAPGGERAGWTRSRVDEGGQSLFL